MKKRLLQSARAKRVVLSSILGTATVLLMLGLYVGQPLFLRQLDNRIYDLYLTSRPKVAPSPVPVIIDIDEDSLTRYGQWPWPRYRVASLVQEAASRGAVVVALDILLAEPDNSSPAIIRDTLRKDMGVAIGFSGLPPGLDDYDALLADTIAKNPVVLGMYARFGGKEPVKDTEFLPDGVTVIEQSAAGSLPMTSRLLKADGATVPVAKLRGAAPAGLINMAPDTDGFVRRAPAIVQAGDRIYVNLGLRALMAALGRKNIVAVSGPDGLESLRIGPYSVPVSPEGNVLVPYTGPRGEYEYVSAAAVLDKSLPADAFEGRILFVGTSAPGLLDIRATPFDSLYPGSEVHAALLDAVITGRFISVPPWTPGLQVFCITALGIIAGIAFSVAKPRVYSVVVTIILLAVFYGSWRLFEVGFFLSPLYPALTVASLGLLLLMLRFWLEERQKVALRKAFSRYVAPEVVRRVTEYEGDLLAGEERELSIMFTDIRGFTAISEQLDPRQVVSLLNRYFTPMTALVRENAGTLDKFVGDALMAFWNAPLAVENHPVLAVATALRMQEEAAKLNESLLEEFGCTIRMGAGIHTGKVYVGNMGSDDLVNYTLIGDSVNLASRLEGLCVYFDAATIVSAATMNYCLEAAPSRFFFLQLDTLRVKGREQPVSVYAAMQPEEGQTREAEFAAYREAVALYQAGNFIEAAAAFRELADAHPDRGLYGMYALRTSLLLTARPEDWDGIWTLESK